MKMSHRPKHWSHSPLPTYWKARNRFRKIGYKYLLLNNISILVQFTSLQPLSSSWVARKEFSKIQQQQFVSWVPALTQDYEPFNTNTFDLYNREDVRLKDTHCVKSVRIRSYSAPYFPTFWLNTERYRVSLRIQSECGKIRTIITLNTDTFYAVAVDRWLRKVTHWGGCSTRQ